MIAVSCCGSLPLGVLLIQGGEHRHAGGSTFDPWRDRITHLGLYVDKASVVFKLTEKLSREVKSPSSNRSTFIPMLRLDLSGGFLECIAIGVIAVNVSGGISGVDLNPMGDCACGERDTIPADSTETETSHVQASANNAEYLQAGDHQRKGFLRGSLFEKDFGDEAGTCKERKFSYSLEWDQHLETVTEDTLLERSPAVALDMLHCLDLSDDDSNDQQMMLPRMRVKDDYENF